MDEVFDLIWKRIPTYTIIRYIIGGVSSPEIETCFRNYSAELAAHRVGRRYVPFDGKVLRGSFDHFKDQKAVQILSAFLTDSDIILATEEIAEKTNEIPTAQELILRLGLSNCVFTLDALHFQTQTLAAAMATGNEVIVQVKANQPILLQDCLSTAASEEPLAVYQEPVTKAHHRIEGRTVSVFAPQSIREVEKWHLVEAIVNVDRQRQEFDTKAKCWQHSDELSFYIATVLLTASEFGEAIR